MAIDENTPMKTTIFAKSLYYRCLAVLVGLSLAFRQPLPMPRRRLATGRARVPRTCGCQRHHAGRRRRRRPLAT